MDLMKQDPRDGVTMSSREIADLCDKQHKHVLRDIERMLAELGEPKFGPSSFEAEYTTEQNKQAKEYHLPKDLTVTLITGYRADLRYKVVKRLEELEARRAAHAPRTRGKTMGLTKKAHRTDFTMAHFNTISLLPRCRIIPAVDCVARFGICWGMRRFLASVTLQR